MPQTPRPRSPPRTVRHRPHRRGDDGEPVLRPLPRLAARAPTASRPGSPTLDRYRRAAPDPPPDRVRQLRLPGPRPLLRGRPDRAQRRQVRRLAALRQQRQPVDRLLRAGRPAVPRQRGAGLDDLRPLLRRGDGRDLPQPLLPALRADRPAAQLDADVSHAADASGTGSRAKGVSGHVLLLRHPVHRRCGARKYLGDRRRRSRHVLHRRRGRHAARRSRFVDPQFLDEDGGTVQRRPPARRHPGRRGVPEPGLRRGHAPARTGPTPSWSINYDEWGGFFDHVAARHRARRQPEDQPARLPRADAGHLAARPSRPRRPPDLRPHLGAEDDRVALGPQAADPARRARPQPRRGARLRQPRHQRPRPTSSPRSSPPRVRGRRHGDLRLGVTEWPALKQAARAAGWDVP